MHSHLNNLDGSITILDKLVENVGGVAVNENKT